ncbi:hypothetical protein K437DRAFT_119183 [Tilletiaria anomala UBC 951]|uniref:Ras GEF n=1 Tax=Tilletiaria anomala (strain ATCC 24038 / CBS 436.72 / UBC 951) TaxID=1037660 RepID=A0A066W4R3_TILAU|nr:uncharacterized protein K437DRAFT_119183 [Tilletiaria anomala UBC 951]KDN45760.1 hypothetical protein K437DRAFT_119183 [Tilletiaria anomala UBC 951]
MLRRGKEKRSDNFNSSAGSSNSINAASQGQGPSEGQGGLSASLSSSTGLGSNKSLPVPPLPSPGLGGGSSNSLGPSGATSVGTPVNGSAALGEGDRNGSSKGTSAAAVAAAAANNPKLRPEQQGQHSAGVALPLPPWHEAGPGAREAAYSQPGPGRSTGLPQSISIDIHPLQQQQQATAATHGFQQLQQQASSLGRSQSAFNFLLSKAKASFGSNQQNQGQMQVQSAAIAQQQQLMQQGGPGVIHSSSSMPAVQEGWGMDAGMGMAFGGNGAGAPYIPMRRGSSGPGLANGGSTIHGQREQGVEDPYGLPPRPSFATDEISSPLAAASSPTKRSFFSMGRERKPSQTSVSAPRQSFAVAQSPLGRSSMALDREGERMMGLGMGMAGYGYSSRSQSDLHARSDVPPLPPDAAAAASRAAFTSANTHANPNADLGTGGFPAQRSPYLRSPSPNFVSGNSMAFSRSVDDLSQFSSPALMPTSPGAASITSSGSMAPPHKLRVLGLDQQQPPPQQPHQSQSYQHGRAASIIVSSGNHQAMGAANGQRPPAMPPLPPQHQQQNRLREAQQQHARKASRLPFSSKEAQKGTIGTLDASNTGSAGRSQSLANSLGVATASGSASSAMRQVSSSSTGATSMLSSTDSACTGAGAGVGRGVSASPQSMNIPLPPGASFQGLLNRNINISLSYAQLNEGKEKDITKGWKPYKVVMQNGNLQFYKPPSGLVEEVRAVFPAGIVRPTPKAATGGLSDQYNGIAPLDAEALKRSGLNTRDLLSATASSGSIAASSPSSQRATSPTNGNLAESPSFKQLSLPSPSPSVPRLGTVEQNPGKPDVPRFAAPWVRPDHHPELKLVVAQEDPGSWERRVDSGSLPALAHELVHATQATEKRSPSVANRDTTITMDGVTEEAGEECRTFVRSLVVAAILHHDALASLLDEVAKACKTSQSKSAPVRMLIAALEPELISRKAKEQAIAALRTICEAVQAPLPAWVATFEAAKFSDDIPCAAIEASKRTNLRPLLNGAFPDGLLVTLPPQEIAQQIQAWHVRETSQVLRPYLDLSSILNAREQKNSLLSFDTKSLHPVTELVLEQVFSVQSQASDNGPTAAAGQAQAVARHRAAILRHWIAVTSYLQAYGDIAGWTAVVAALCSRAVARLETTWRFVAPGDKDLMAKFWCPSLAKVGWTESMLSTQVNPLLSSPDIPNPKGLHGESLGSIPFLGSLDLPGELQMGTDGGVELDLRRSNRLSTQLFHLLAEVQKDAHSANSAFGSEIRPVVPLLLEYKTLFDAYRTRPRPEALTFYLERSYHIEPRTLGSNGISWRQRPSQTVAANATTPLLFVNPLPLQRVVDPEWISQAANGDLPKLPNFNDGEKDATITHSSQLQGAAPNAAAMILRSKTLPFASLKGDRRSPFLRTFKPVTVGTNDHAEIRIGTELILRPMGESLGNSSASPCGSKRFSQDFARSSRPPSQVSKRSSLPASNRSSIADTGTVMLVEVKAATLERMIDVILMGVRHIQVQVSDDNGEVPLSLRSQLSLDTGDLTAAFLGTYRGICSPGVLFDLLRKRFVGAINAGRELALPVQQRSSSQFPSWSYPISTASSSAQSVDWDTVTRVRVGVLSILRKWLHDYAQDFIDDRELWAATSSFLRERPTLDEFEDDPDRARIAAFYEDAASAFKLHLMRPNLDAEAFLRKTSLAASNFSPPSSSQTDPFDIDKASAQEVVDYLEPVATVFAEKITRRDYLIVSEIFERQASDTTGWFPPRKSSGEDGVSGTTMYKMLEIIRLAGANPQSLTLQQALPGAVRDVCAAQNLLRGWIAIQITEPRIGLVKRQERLSKLLDAIFICRARMSKGRGLGADGPHTVFQKACIAGFVESAITSSITSSESRIFSAAWQGVAQARQGSVESLTRLGPQAEIAKNMWDVAGQRACTIDIGWILGCLAEAITQPYDVSDDAAPLIPWDKYRNVWNLINASGIGQQQTSQAELDVASARLKSMQIALGGVIWDRKFFKEEASREASYAPAGSTSSRWRSMKPLNNFLAEQHERQKRLRMAFDAIDQDSKAASDAAAAAELRKANSNATIAPTAPASEKRARRMTALFRNAVRPVLHEKHDQAAAATRPPAELLTSIPTSKASLIARCGAAQVSVWSNSQRSFIFHLTTAEGGKYLLQAPSQGEMTEWIRIIDQAAKAFIPRRPASRGSASGNKGVPLFGVPLFVIVEREARLVPIAIERMFAEIEARGLREQGIYRISGAKSAIMGLKAAFERQPADQVNLSTGDFSDVHTIAGLIKQWFRDLPEPCIPFNCYHRMIAAEQIENEEDRLTTIRELIWSFPKPHFNLLERTSQHLSRVVEEGKENLMAPHNIGLVFGEFIGFSLE